MDRTSVGAILHGRPQQPVDSVRADLRFHFPGWEGVRGWRPCPAPCHTSAWSRLSSALRRRDNGPTTSACIRAGSGAISDGGRSAPTERGMHGRSVGEGFRRRFNRPDRICAAPVMPSRASAVAPNGRTHAAQDPSRRGRSIVRRWSSPAGSTDAWQVFGSELGRDKLGNPTDWVLVMPSTPRRI